jgi:hypothetical protein
MKPYTPAAYGLTGLPGPTGRGMHHQGSLTSDEPGSSAWHLVQKRVSAFTGGNDLPRNAAKHYLIGEVRSVLYTYSRASGQNRQWWQDIRRPHRAARLSSPMGTPRGLQPGVSLIPKWLGAHSRAGPHPSTSNSPSQARMRCSTYAASAWQRITLRTSATTRISRLVLLTPVIGRLE